VLRVGESGALFMAVNGVPYGPVGPSGEVTSNVALSAEAITGTYQVADLTEEVLADYVAVASASGPVARRASGRGVRAAARARPDRVRQRARLRGRACPITSEASVSPGAVPCPCMPSAPGA
jgi:hypothetical protein